MPLLIIGSMLLLGLAIVAVITYRARRTFGFLLLMLASICYVVPRVAHLGSGIFFSVHGWKTPAARAFRGWLYSYGITVLWSFDSLFIVLLVAALVFFIRERRTVTPQA